MKPYDCTNFTPNVMIIGTNFMQNELLASYITKNTGMKCMQQPNVDIASISRKESNGSDLFLLDAKGDNFYQLWENLKSEFHPTDSGCIFALYNLDPENAIGIEAVERGLQGLFYNNEPIDVIPKGIKAILDGEMWYSRKIMAEYLLSWKKLRENSEESSQELTEREKEILHKLFSGYSNIEIADDFCISYNTVKTHIYNIYKKINVENRFQATLWASKHL